MTEPEKSTPRAVGRPRCPTMDRAILDATLGQLAEQGYARMSVDVVAANAGTTKPTIYRRWPSKEALAVAALADFQAKDEPTPTGNVEADLTRLLGDFGTKLLRPNGMSMIGTLLAEEAHTPGLIELFRQNIVRPRRERLLAILAGAKSRRELREDADLDVAVNMMVGSFYARYLTGDPIPSDWPVRVVETALRGLRE